MNHPAILCPDDICSFSIRSKKISSIYVYFIPDSSLRICDRSSIKTRMYSHIINSSGNPWTKSKTIKPTVREEI
jgi:hypothetical protein